MLTLYVDAGDLVGVSMLHCAPVIDVVVVTALRIGRV